MSTSRKVAVLLPNFNNGPFLKEALDSVFAQSFQDFKVYLIDDCSTDNGLEIARAFEGEQFEIIVKENNSGIVDTMNIGLEMITEPYIIRMDGDDISTPDRFQILVDFMEENKHIGVCSSAIRTFGSVDELLSFEKSPEVNKANLIFGHSVGHASSIFKTDIFKKNNIQYVDRFWRMEDYYLFYQLRNLTECTAIDDELYLYRREDYNFNPEIMEKKRKEFYRFYQMVFEDLGLEVSERDLSMHIQLSGREPASFTFEQYDQHIQRLLEANNSVKAFPQNELKKVFDKYMGKLIFQLVDKKLVSFSQLLPLFSRFKGLFRYYCANKLGRS